ncbi:hypothetical protein LUZ60_005081 [Juncus effusus]|nr:hypothetical protein LUZ60_005081 [Juncus effusus]
METDKETRRQKPCMRERNTNRKKKNPLYLSSLLFLSLFGPCILLKKGPFHLHPSVRNSEDLLTFYSINQDTHKERQREKSNEMREMGGRKLQSQNRVVSSPCAGCKLLRRRCAQDCVFAPYFPATEPLKFASVHKVFGASNVSKLLQEIPIQHRGDAVSSLVYEANARVRDPIYGCVGAISALQNQIESLQTQLALAQAEMINLKMGQAAYLTHQLAHTKPTNNNNYNSNNDDGDNYYIALDKGNNNSSSTSSSDANLKAMCHLDMDSPMWSC